MWRFRDRIQVRKSQAKPEDPADGPQGSDQPTGVTRRQVLWDSHPRRKQQAKALILPRRSELNLFPSGTDSPAGTERPPPANETARSQPPR